MLCGFVLFVCVCVMVSLFLCRPFVVDFVDALVVAVFGLCVNYILIVLLDSCTPTGVSE